MLLATAPSTWWFGWEAADLPMLLALPFLLLFSGLISGSETALFGLSGAQRLQLRLSGGVGSVATDTLLRDPPMLLITILLANTTINVAYFVTSSLLLMHSEANAFAQAALAAFFLLFIVLGGEVLPKALADAHRMRLAPLCAPPLLTFHTIIAPLRIVLGRGVIAPLARLFVPSPEVTTVDDQALRALISVSGSEGVIDAHEHHLLEELLDLRRRKVRDVMTPRTRMAAIPDDADRATVQRMVREHRQLTFPVYHENLDSIVGVLHVKRYLTNPSITRVTDARALTKPRFVPEIATLDHLLERFSVWHERAAIVVDEYGGTEGTVTVEDVVEEIVGDIVIDDAPAVSAPQMIGLDRWAVAGDWSVHDFIDAFALAVDVQDLPITTVGGLVTDRLGRAAEIGDRAVIGNLTITVTGLDGTRIASIEICPDSPLNEGGA